MDTDSLTGLHKAVADVDRTRERARHAAWIMQLTTCILAIAVLVVSLVVVSASAHEQECKVTSAFHSVLGVIQADSQSALQQAQAAHDAAATAQAQRSYDGTVLFIQQVNKTLPAC